MGFTIKGWREVRTPIVEMDYTKKDKHGGEKTWKLQFPFDEMADVGAEMKECKSFRLFTDQLGSADLTIDECDKIIWRIMCQLKGLEAPRAVGQRDPLLAQMIQTCIGKYALPVTVAREKLNSREAVKKFCKVNKIDHAALVAECEAAIKRVEGITITLDI